MRVVLIQQVRIMLGARVIKTILVRESVQTACKFFGHEQAPLVVLISGAGAPAEFCDILTETQVYPLIFMILTIYGNCTMTYIA